MTHSKFKFCGNEETADEWLIEEMMQSDSLRMLQSYILTCLKFRNLFVLGGLINLITGIHFYIAEREEWNHPS